VSAHGLDAFRPRRHETFLDRIAITPGAERMDKARRAAGDITCRLTVTEISDTRNVPIAWRGEWVKR
jgi:hypothetical protein